MKLKFFTSLALLCMVGVVALAQTTQTATTNTHTAKVRSTTTDAANWSITPEEASTTGVSAGTTVTATYSGNLNVKSVKAVKNDPLSVPLTIEALTEGTLVVETPIRGMHYAKNGGEKIQINSVENLTINVVVGDKVQFYGNGTKIEHYNNDETYTSTILVHSSGTALVKVYGNIMSLVDEENFATATTLTATRTFYRLFGFNETLIDASGLLLPATSMSASCYANMFEECHGLKTVPELPAENLSSGCFAYMFSYCTALETAPALPAETLNAYCYEGMFYNCSALTAAPELPAETLAKACYNAMFSGCTKLSSVTCKAIDITATDCTKNWLKNAGTAVSGTKTVTGYASAGWQENSISGVPEGWTFNALAE